MNSGKNTGNRIYLALFGALLFMSAGSRLSGLYIDHLWFRQFGQQQTFFTLVLSPWLAGIAFGAITAMFLYANLSQTRPDFHLLPHNLVPIEIRRWLQPSYIRVFFLLIAAFFGLLFGAALSGNWLDLLLYMNSSPFPHPEDPIFGLNPSFYIFTLPVLQTMVQTLVLLLLLCLLASGAIYFVTGQIRQTGSRILFENRSRRHLALLGAALLFLKAFDYYLSRYQLLYSTRGASYGASYTDVHVQLPVLYLLAILAVLSGILLAVHAWRPVTRLILYSIGTLLVVSLAGGGIIPGLFQQFIVRPNELALERPYIRNNIDMTLRAWDLDNVTQNSFPANDDLDAEEIAANIATVDNIRVWDWRVLQSSYQQLQAIRPYYRFQEMDVDRYMVDGVLRQMILSAREISYDQLPEGSNTWINRHLIYTHGYGFVATPAAAVTAEGLPPFLISDIPPKASGGFQIERPEIYYGELTSEYALIGTSEDEFDYPQQGGNAYTRYEGSGGIPIGGWLSRISLAWYTGDVNILLSGAITGETRAMIYRDIAERVRKLAPFLHYDSDPFLVLADGRLYWVQDAYTISGRYPYSEPYGTTGINYMRNSVKAVTDAYNGTVRFYVTGTEDPLIQAYRSIFPDLFSPVEEAPLSIREHFRYPENLFSMQLETFAQYHMTDVDVFYNGEDHWERPFELFAGEPQTVDPYYVIIQLAGMEQPEFMLMSPMTPRGSANNRRDNMIAWISGQADLSGKNQLLVYNLPRDKTVYGPMQIESRINQDSEISQNLNLWNQQGSSVIRGNLLVIPIGDSILYVEPIYLRSTSAQLPELRRVIVMHGNRTPVMAPTLAQALVELFGSGAVRNSTVEPVPPDEDPADNDGGAAIDEMVEGAVEELRRQARRAQELYDEALEALRRGNWSIYGERIEQLGEILRRLEAGTDTR